MPRDESMLNRNPPATCNPDPSRTPRRLLTDPCQRSLRPRNDCTRNYTPNDRRCPTTKSKGRPLNMAMEMERDKQIARERYRSSSTDGRFYVADLDISNNNCYPNGVCYAPPNLKGRSLNIAAEVQRDIRLALARSRAGPDRRISPQGRNNLSQGTSQIDNILSDSGTENVTANKSYNFVTSTPQFTGATDSTSARTTSREGSPTHATSPSSRPKQEYGASDAYPGTGKTITRTVVTTKTTRTNPPQISRNLPSNSFYEAQGKRNTSLDVPTARYKDQSPAIGIWRQPTFNNSQPLSISSFASNATSHAGKASQNPMQCPKEFFDAQHDPFANINANFGMPAAESTRYETTDERQYSPNGNDIARTLLRGNDYRLGSTQIDEYYSEEDIPPYECPRSNVEQPNGCPNAMNYTNFQSITQLPTANLNVTKTNVNDRTRDAFSQKPSGPSNVTTQGGYFASPEATRQQCELESFRRSSYPIPQQLQQCIPDSANVNGPNQFFMSQYNNNEFSRRQLCDRSQRSEVSRSVLECAEAKRCGRVQFDETDNYEIQNIQQIQMRKNQMETLVIDTYCPGIIQETLDGKKDFNSISFKLSFGANLSTLYDDECNSFPSHDPMSLLEAFSLRIDKDRREINKDLPDEPQETSIKETVNKHFDHRNPSDLNRCIKSLLLSEHIIDTIPIVKAKTLSFTADVHRNVSTCPVFDAPTKLIIYTGRTKPVKMPE